MILRNGPVYTMDPRLPRVAALAIAGGAIAGGVDVREGDSDAVGHERIDLDGRCVVPGFSDAHVHFQEWSLARVQLDLRGCRSKAEALRQIAAAGGNGWLRGRGFEPVRWPDGPVSAADLDAVCGERPVALWSHDGHTLWLSSAALAAAGVAHPTGVLQEREAFAFPLPAPEPLEISQAVRAGIAAAQARGVVAVHDFQRPGGRGLWQRLDADRRLHLRVHMTVPVEMLGAATALELRTGFGSEHVRVGPVKVFMDGALGSGTAWMLDGSGAALVSAVELAAIAREAAAGGLSLAVHAIGDGAVRAALDGFEQSRDAWEQLAVPPRIEHAQCVDDADLPRFGALGVTASVQPVHAMDDRDLADRIWGARAAAAYRWHDLLDAGAHLAFGSDAPVADLDPLAGIAAAVHRSDDGREPWYPEQRLDVADAVLGFTAGAAAAVGEHRRRGLLLPGYAADLAVLDTDIVAHPERIAEAKVVATMLGGRWVHGAPPW
ncbi:MAG TPA: amidohydrolase [Gaiellales bacterium]